MPVILGYCFGAGVASAGDIISECGAAEDIHKAAEVAHPGDSIIVPKGKFPFHGQAFLPDEVGIRGAGKNDTLPIKMTGLGMEARCLRQLDARQPIRHADR